MPTNPPSAFPRKTCKVVPGFFIAVLTRPFHELTNLAPVTANIYTRTRLPHQADALKQLDTQLDEPEPKARRRRSSETPSASEGDICSGGTEEPPPAHTNRKS